ncbi:N-6 DNA methylase [Halorussus limi]|uniref:N-6 DNA methylase n=1 Tax=Halorussus limi TaxID=2938695 RepID=A0A8U0HS33_9EURY|nr:N-6 DNA methylase [Halorussus limi]UPV73912.1 N-6 DNA methylase [Halorussus limi]
MDRLAGTNLALPNSGSQPGAYRTTRRTDVDTSCTPDDCPITTPVPPRVTPETPASFPRLDESVVDDDLLDRLSAAADHLAATVDSASLETAIQTWSERHGLDTLPQDERRTVLARHSVISILLKTTLYEWYQRRGDLSALSADIRAALQHAYHETGDAAFRELPVDRIIWRADDDIVTPVVEARDCLLTSRNPAEDIGQVYERLTTSESRQSLGQFRTPPAVGRLLRSWVTTGDDTVLDPGIGSGVLSSPFHPHWLTDLDPKKVFGVDQSPLSMLMGTTALTLSGQSHEPQTVDFLTLSPDDLPGEVDGIVSNPPFTGAQALPASYKRRCNARFEDSTGRTISGKSPLYTYFLYHSREFLGPGDRAAFITPQSWLSRKFGETLKRFLLDEYRIKSLVRFNPEATSIFDTADETALLVCLEVPAEDAPTGDTRFVRVDEDVDTNEIRDAIDGVVDGETLWGEVVCRQQEQLDPTSNWQSLFDRESIETHGLVPLRTLATCRRGAVTGAVNFFCLSQQTVDEYGISEEQLSRLIRRPSVVDGYDFTEIGWAELRESGAAVWLLDPDELSNVPDEIATFAEQVRSVPDSLQNDGDETGLQPYLRTAVTVHDLVGTDAFDRRTYWYRPPRHDPPQIVVPDTSRDGFPFVLNEVRARNVHNFHGLHGIRLAEVEMKALLAYLNSEFTAQLLTEETYTRQDGYESLSISDLRELPVIDPQTLPDDVVSALADAFEELRTATRRSGNSDSAKKRIMTILEQELQLRLPSDAELE